jgi:hypothetical protein
MPGAHRHRIRTLIEQQKSINTTRQQAPYIMVRKACASLPHWATHLSASTRGSSALPCVPRSQKHPPDTTRYRHRNPVPVLLFECRLLVLDGHRLSPWWGLPQHRQVLLQDSGDQLFRLVCQRYQPCEDEGLQYNFVVRRGEVCFAVLCISVFPSY